TPNSRMCRAAASSPELGVNAAQGANISVERGRFLGRPGPGEVIEVLEPRRSIAAHELAVQAGRLAEQAEHGPVDAQSPPPRLRHRDAPTRSRLRPFIPLPEGEGTHERRPGATRTAWTHLAAPVARRLRAHGARRPCFAGPISLRSGGRTAAGEAAALATTWP